MEPERSEMQGAVASPSPSSSVAAAPIENSPIYDMLRKKQVPGRFNSEEFVSCACNHKKILHEKLQLEKKTQHGHSLLWTYPDHQKTLEGICGCRNSVRYEFTFQVAQFDVRIAQSLKDDFENLHAWNVDNVFMSLYHQTHSELNFSNFVSNQAEILRSTVC